MAQGRQRRRRGANARGLGAGDAAPPPACGPAPPLRPLLGGPEHGWGDRPGATPGGPGWGGRGPARRLAWLARPRSGRLGAPQGRPGAARRGPTRPPRGPRLPARRRAPRRRPRDRRAPRGPTRAPWPHRAQALASSSAPGRRRGAAPSWQAGRRRGRGARPDGLAPGACGAPGVAVGSRALAHRNTPRPRDRRRATRRPRLGARLAPRVGIGSRRATTLLGGLGQGEAARAVSFYGRRRSRGHAGLEVRRWG